MASFADYNALFGAGQVKKPGFFDRAAADLGSIASGFMPGIMEIGKTLGNDFSTALTGSGDYRLDDLGKGMWGGFKDQSFLVPFAQGDFGEAAHRFSDRPVSGLLDASIVFPAAGAASTIGRKVGTAGSREAFARFGGFKTLHPETRDQIKTALAMRDTTGDPKSVFGSMPATLKFTDEFGGIEELPTREFLNNPQFESIGDTLMARQTNRSLVPTSQSKAPDQTGTYESHVDSIQNPIGTFEEDSYKDLVGTRSPNELAASLGDKAAGLYDKVLPSDPFARRSGKLAKSFARDHTRAMYADQDRGSRSIIQIKADLVNDFRAEYPQYASLSDEEILEMGGNRFTAEAMGVQNTDGLRDTASLYEPRNPEELGELSDADMMMTPTDFEINKGIRFARRRDQYGELVDKELRPFASYATVKEFWDEHLPKDNIAGYNKLDDTFENRYELRTVSPKMQELLKKRNNARMEIQGMIESLVDDMEGYGGYSLVVDTPEGRVPLTRELLDNTPGGFVNRFLRPQADSASEFGDVTPVIRRDAQGLIDFAKSPAAQIDHAAAQLWDENLDAPVEGPLRMPEQQELGAFEYLDDKRAKDAALDARVDELARQIGRYNNYNSMHSTLAKNTGHYLRNPSFNNQRPEMQEGMDPIVPGLSQTMRSIADSPTAQVMDEAWNSDSFAKMIGALRALQDLSLSRAREYLHPSRLNDERVTRNQNRTSRWSHPEGLGPTEGVFFKMQLPKRGKREGIDHETNLSLDDPALTSNPGDPWELWVKGGFRRDLDSHADDFKLNSRRAHERRLLDGAKGLGRAVSPEELQILNRHGEVASEWDINKPSSRTREVLPSFIAVQMNGPLAQHIRSTVESLDTLATRVAESGDKNAERQVRDVADMVRAMSAEGRDGVGLKGLTTNSQLMENPELSTDVHIIPSSVYKALTRELKPHEGPIERIIKDIGDEWKPLVLYWRFPSFFRNNLIGSAIFHAMHSGPIDAVKSFKKAHEPGMKSMLDENFPGVGSHSSQALARDMQSTILSNRNKYYDAYQNLMRRFADVNSKWADEPWRNARLVSILRGRAGEMQKIYDHFGFKVDMTHPDEMERLMTDPRVNKRVYDEMLTDMVDFTNLSRFERDIVSSFFPFWAFTKGSTKSLFSLAADHPERVWVMGQIADLGTRENVADFGAAAPDFARGMVDVGMGDLVMSTSGMNPFGAPIELGNFGINMVPGGMGYRAWGSENIANQLNPVLSGWISALSGRNMYFGTPLPDEGIGTSFLKSTLGGLPPVKFTKDMILNKQGPDSTSTQSRGLDMTSYAGIPVTQPRWAALYSRGIDEAQERYGTTSAIGWLNPQYPAVSPR